MTCPVRVLSACCAPRAVLDSVQHHAVISTKPGLPIARTLFVVLCAALPAWGQFPAAEQPQHAIPIDWQSQPGWHESQPDWNESQPGWHEGQPDWNDRLLATADSEVERARNVSKAWVIDVSPMWLGRTRGNEYEIGRFVTPAGDTAARLTSRDVDYHLDAGLYIDTSFGTEDNDRLQLIYSMIDDWNEFEQLPNPGGTTGISSLLGAAAISNSVVGDSFLYSTRSQFFNAELNRLRPVGDNGTQLTQGIRFIHFGDNLSAEGIQFSGLSEVTRIASDNNLLGLSMGLQRPFGHGRITWLGFAKASLMVNFLRQKSNNSGLSGSFPAANVDVSDVGLSTVAEFGLRARIKLKEWLSLQGGYRLMSIQGLALAPDQIPLISTADGFLPSSGLPIDIQERIEHSGAVWLHGFTISMEVIW